MTRPPDGSPQIPSPSDPDPDEIPGWLSVLILTWPALLWAVGFALVQIATLGGCKIWAKGPETCTVLGADMGGLFYNMFLMSWFLLAGAVFWMPIGLVLIGLVRYLRRNSF